MAKDVRSLSGRLRHALGEGFGEAAFRARLWAHRIAGSDVRRAQARPAVLIVPMAVAGTLALAAFVPQLLSPWRWPQLQQLHAQARAVELIDARGRFVGVMPAVLQHGRPVAYRTLVPERVPQGFFDVLKALEDRHLGSWRSWHGLDVPRMARNLMLAVLGRPQGGGSSLSMQLARSLHAMSPDGGTPLLSRKLIELLDGMVLYHRLGGAEGRALRRWLAMHLPLAQGLRRVAPLGGEVRGVALAARIFWSKSVGKLSLAEQAVLAAAVQRPVILLPSEAPEDARQLQQRRWRRIKARAAIGLQLAYGRKAAEVRAALAELTAMPVPQPDDDRLARLAAPDAAARRLRVAANPEVRAAVLVGSQLRTIHQQLQRRHGTAYGAEVRQVHLAIDMADNLRFRRRVREALARISRHPRLVADLEREADVLVAVADAGGHIRRLYQSRPGLLHARFQPGSVAKMIAAVALARLGDSPDARYCRLPLSGAGGRCQGMLSAREAFARSDNQAIWTALARVPERELRQLAAAFGFRIHSGTPPRTALTLGLGEMTPWQMLRMALVLAALAEEKPNATLQEAHLPAQARQVAGALQLGDRARGYLRAVLHAPLEPGGTLQRLPRMARGVRWIIAKSGTTDSPGGNTRGKWAAAVFRRNGEMLVLVATIFGRGYAPLGRGLGDLIAPLLAAAAK